MNIPDIPRIIIFGDFFNSITSLTCQPVAMLAGISNANNSSTSSNGFTSEVDSSSKAGSTSINNSGTSEIMGVAVFKYDKLVGELNARETMCHLLITNKLESCNITISDPNDRTKNIDLFIYNRSNPKIKVDIVNGSPYIEVNLKLDAKILSEDDNSNYITKNKLTEISNSAESYIQSIVYDYLYKTSKELNSDIDNFGQYALRHFSTTPELEEYNWLENYKNAFFNANVDVKVKSAFLLGG